MSTMSIKAVRPLIKFLEPPGDDFKCPICCEILQEPHLTTCCGSHHICKVCIENVKGANGGCPFCKEKPLNAFIDKRFERQLNELTVYCISEGCNWSGNFGKIEQHLNLGKENGECEFVVVECPVSVECKKQFTRKNLKHHINNVCVYRQAQCVYCGSVSTYQDITSIHPKSCAKYPLLCPNKCSDQTYPRDQLCAHLASCPEHKVDCTFSEMGCKEKMKRRHLQEHLDTNSFQHQVILCQTFKKMKKDKEKVEEELEVLKKSKKELEDKVQQMRSQEDNQIKSLKYVAKSNNQLQSTYFSKMAELSSLYPVAPVALKASFDITMSQEGNRYNKSDYGYCYTVKHYTAAPYLSQLFYSHPNGYKLQLSAELVCHCSNCRKPEKEKRVVASTQRSSHGTSWVQLLSKRTQVDNSGICNDSIDNRDVIPSNYPGKVTSFALNLHIFKGDHDSQLKWPFKKKAIISIYQQEEQKNQRGFATTTMLRNPNCCNRPHAVARDIPHAVAVFEGSQNYASTGSKLDIKPLKDSQSVDLPQPPTSQTSFAQHDAQMLSVSIEKGLLIPLNLSSCNPLQGNKTVYFEVTLL